jgi:hypothetical protein
LSKLNSNEPIMIETEVTNGNYNASEVVTLRIRSETGKRTMIVKLLMTDKINSVYKLVKPYLYKLSSIIPISIGKTKERSLN